MMSETDSAGPQRIYRSRDLPSVTGLQRTLIGEMVKRGEFPRPIPLSDSGRAVGWLESDVVEWQKARAAKRATAKRKTA